MDPALAQAAGSAVDVVSRLLTPQNLGMSAALWLVLELARRLFPGLFQSGVFKRVLPVLPEAIGAAAYWLVPALAAPGATVGERLLVGIAVGTGSSKVRKLIHQSVLGADDDIVAAKKKTINPASSPEQKEP